MCSDLKVEMTKKIAIYDFISEMKKVLEDFSEFDRKTHRHIGFEFHLYECE